MNSFLWLDVEGLVLTKDDRRRILHPSTAGVILFSRNYKDLPQLRQLTNDIHALNPDMIIAVDHEGGRVQRFREGFTEIPAMGTLGEAWEDNPDRAREMAYAFAQTMARELKSAGVDLTFAPVLDINYGRSDIIGKRAFHTSPEGVIELADAFIDGLHAEKMWAVGKHFPGHGFVKADSHVADPVDERDLELLLENDLRPYMALGNKLDAVMTAHIVFPQVDERLVTYSPYWLKTILREQLNFSGIVFSDDLAMHAATHLPVLQRVEEALAAGCDYVLLCNDPAAVDVVQNM
ncbi:MAG: beta-N-acetylhexosaminidase [Gammaproteobacteria bacterium]